MRSTSAGGRDRPHSPGTGQAAGSAAGAAPGAARDGGPGGLQGSARPVGHPGQPGRPGHLGHMGHLGIGLVLAAVVAAASPLPTGGSGWAGSAEHPVVAASSGPLAWLWDALVLALPLGERGVREEFAALLLVLGVAAAAGSLAFHLYRGTGRGPAAVAAVPVSAALLLAWLREVGASGAIAGAGPAVAASLAPSALVGVPAALGFTLCATLALTVFIGARVRGHRTTAADWIRGAAATLAAALLWPRAGVGLAALLLGYATWSRSGRRGAARWLATLGVATAPLWLGWLAIRTGSFGHALSDMSLARLWTEELRLAPDLGALARWTGPGLHPALALLVLLVLPLRWRGGGLLLALATAGLTIADRRGLLLPAPMSLVLLAVAGCGWIWLAGSVRVRTRWVAPLCAWGAAIAVLWTAAAVVVPVQRPVAADRPELSLLALHQRGLLAPGDVLLAHEPWLAAAFAAAQRDEGLRPDVELHAAGQIDPQQLSEKLASWSRAGRRVLSDSFSYAGRWQAAWALDSGPLFWFIGTASAGELDFTDLHAHSPELGDPRLRPAERARWERLHVERARHRRALGRHDEALLALPLDAATLTALAQRLHLAKLSRLPAAEGSELGPAPWTLAPAPASALAEAGDLLLSLGDGPVGAERLAEAASRGVAEAFGALARWQLRAGEEEAARSTLAVIAAAPVLRGQLLAVCRWLLARTRAAQASALLGGVDPAPGYAAEELATRLAVLRGLASP